MNSVVYPSPKQETVHTRAAKGGLISGVSFALNLGLNLVQVPLLLRFWPQETYGLWLSVGALSTLLTTLDGGHQLFVGNLLNRYYVEDREVFRRTFASAVCMASLTSVVQILLALALCFSGKAARWLGIEPRYSADFALSVVIYTVGWISVGSVGSILVRLFPPTGFFVRSTWWGMGTKLAQFVAIVIAAMLGWGLVGTTLLFAGAVFGVNILLFCDIRRLYPDLYPWWKGGGLRYGFRNFTRSSIVSLVSILDLVSMQGVILLVTSGLGAAVVPLFTTSRTLSNTAIQGTGFLLNPIQPDLVRYHVEQETVKLRSVFGFFWFTTGAVINGGMVAGLFWVEPLYHFWTHGRLEFDRGLFAWLAAAVLLRTLASPLQSYLNAINHLRALLVSSIVRTFLTVVGVIVLAQGWKLAGVGAALFISELVGSLLIPWWFTESVLLRIGGGKRTGMLEQRLAVTSTVIACAALGGYMLKLQFLPWFSLLSFIILIVIAIMQWRLLSPEVRRRAREVGRSFLGLRQTLCRTVS